MFRVILHLDMDAFYASIEQRDDPGLRGKPVIVGAPPTQRGVVCAASYEARKFGVRSALPSATAGRLCPKGIFVRPRMEHYRAESRRIMAIIAAAGVAVETMSIDEAYLDASDSCQAETADASLALALPLARRLKEKIRTECGLTATIGIAANKLMAKTASDHKKPDGLTLISEAEKAAFLRPLPVRTLYGVGKATEEVLNTAGIRTIEDLQTYAGDLRALVGSYGPKLKKFAFGEDDRALELGEEIKSISGEETFLKDTEDRKILRPCLKEQAADIAAKLKRKRLGAHTVQVKVRYSDFTTLTRQISVEEPMMEAQDIYRLGCFLLGRDKLVSRPLRLLGLGVSGLRELAGEQLVLLRDERKGVIK
ncbi:MAG TPA: DNA polymerase IV [Verrucomicrobiae bacterium]|nr:DNA polymerase IV [Verrucomicrobiae bacterium]